MTCLIILCPVTSSGKSETVNTNQLHNKETLNYTDTNISNTLNVLKTSKTMENTPEVYSPLNLHFEQPTQTSKQRKAFKKSLFLKERRSRKLSRKIKKLNFFKERRQNKMDKNPYLLTWIHKLNLNGEI